MNSRANDCSFGSASIGDGPFAPSGFERRTDGGQERVHAERLRGQAARLGDPGAQLVGLAAGGAEDAEPAGVRDGGGEPGVLAPPMPASTIGNSMPSKSQIGVRRAMSAIIPAAPTIVPALLADS